MIEESIRTIRIVFTEPEKNQSLRKIVCIAIKKAFSTNIQEEFNEAQIDAIMSLIPEASFQRLAIGTHCINKDGKMFSVLGLHDLYRRDLDFPMNSDLPLFHDLRSSSDNKSGSALVGLYYDHEKPERQEIIREKMINSQPVLDLNEE